jgi:glycosyltransferase involved in cell wall biosynthesis
MRVMFLNDRLSAAGGSERTLRAQVLGLLARGHAVHLALPAKEVELCRTDPDFREVTWTAVEEAAGFRTARHAAMRLVRAAMDWKADVLEVVNVGGLLGPLGIIHLERHLPVVHAFRDVRPTCPRGDRVLPTGGLCEDQSGLRCLRRGCIPPGQEPRGFRALVDSRLRREALRRAAGVVVESQAMGTLLRKVGVPGSRITVTPLQVEAPTVVKKQPSDCPPTVLGSGLLDNPTKGLSFLLEAFAALQHPDARLLLTGRPGKAWTIGMEALGSRLDPTRVDILGWLQEEELQETLESVRVSAFPSRFFESFGLAGAEASAWERPVVAVDCKGSREWLVDGVTGTLVDRDANKDFTQALDGYLSNPELADKHGAAGRIMIQKRFHPTALLESIEAVYQKAIMAFPNREMSA